MFARRSRLIMVLCAWGLSLMFVVIESLPLGTNFIESSSALYGMTCLAFGTGVRRLLIRSILMVLMWLRLTMCAMAADRRSGTLKLLR